MKVYSLYLQVFSMYYERGPNIVANFLSIPKINRLEYKTLRIEEIRGNIVLPLHMNMRQHTG